jgi:glycosyltransferase involved in cell wall biosynthesis
MNRIYAAVDLVTLSSAYGESFPLAVGEAMASGIPCVATDVGDTAYLIGTAGSVVPPKQPELLALEWVKYYDMGEKERAKIRLAARNRIEEHFNANLIAAKYAQMYEQISTPPLG